MKRLGIYAKPGTEDVVREVREHLAGAGLYVSEELGECDALVAVGGDGTILNAARLALPFRLPVLGINAGRLGFLAGLERHELALLPRLASGEFDLENRMLLEVRVRQGERPVAGGLCLNDAVIARQGVSHAVEIPVSCEASCAQAAGHLLRYRGDGVIFATPTGSTAYNFSAGGPVAQPGVDIILLTPICSHRMPARAIVFPAGTQFRVDIKDEGLALTMDAQPPLALLPGQSVTVQKSEEAARFIRLKTENFLDIVTAKMG